MNECGLRTQLSWLYCPLLPYLYSDNFKIVLFAVRTSLHVLCLVWKVKGQQVPITLVRSVDVEEASHLPAQRRKTGSWKWGQKRVHAYWITEMIEFWQWRGETKSTERFYCYSDALEDLFHSVAILHSQGQLSTARVKLCITVLDFFIFQISHRKSYMIMLATRLKRQTN